MKILPYKMSYEQLLKAVRICNDILDYDGIMNICPVWKELSGHCVVHWDKAKLEEECENICPRYYQCDRIAAKNDYAKLKDEEVADDEIERFMQRYPETEMERILKIYEE